MLSLDLKGLLCFRVEMEGIDVDLDLDELINLSTRQNSFLIFYVIDVLQMININLERQ